MPGKTAQEWYLEAQMLLKLCGYEEAVKAYDHALALKPDNLEALHEKGIALYALKNYDEATKIANQIIKLDAKSPLAYSILGLVATRKNEFDKALELYDEGVSLDPSNPQNGIVLVNKGNLHLYALDDEIKAIETFHEAIQADPTYEFAYNSLGNGLCNLRRYEEAIEYYDKGYKVKANAASLVWKAECLVLANKKKEAVNVYVEAFKDFQAGKPGIGLKEEKIKFLEGEIKTVVEIQDLAEKLKQNSGKQFTARLEALQKKKDELTLKIVSKDQGATLKDLEGLLGEYNALSNEISVKSSGTRTEGIDISLEKTKLDNTNKKPKQQKVDNLDSSKDKTKQAVCCNLF